MEGAEWRSSHHTLHHPSRHGAHGPVLERTLGPQGDLDRLIVVGGHGRAIVAVNVDVLDPKPDLWWGDAKGSKTVTFGEPS